MKPLFHPSLVNPPFGDAALHVEFQFEGRGLLFDIGDVTRLSNRKLLRITDVFVSHAHMDHFAGLDHLVRVCLGRDKRIRLFGPSGFIDRVEHKLHGYTWNLLGRNPENFVLEVTEVEASGRAKLAEFHSRETFRRSRERQLTLSDTLHREPGFAVRYTVLDHEIPSLAFSLEEQRHINIWKNRLDALGLPTGPWLGRLKQWVREEAPADTPVRTDDGREFTLGELTAQVVQIVPGQKLVYITDAAGHEPNAERMIALARGADSLFIESTFLERDRELARAKHHLTAHRAGEIARRAGVRRMEPMHFSARYEGMAEQLRAEALAAFSGEL
jgi:ribonuclease Z